MSVEFDLRKPLNDETPEPIELLQRSSVVRVVFDFRKSLSADALTSSIKLCSRMSVLRVEFDLRESLNALAADISIAQSQNGVNFAINTLRIGAPVISSSIIVGASTNFLLDLIAVNMSLGDVQTILSI